jgi:hypothetical protein
MTKEDKEELKEMIHNIFDGRFTLIEYKLDAIQEQTTKTNGRVTLLEKQELLHIPNCPQGARITEIEDTQKKNLAIKKWLIVTVGLASTLAGLAWVILQIITKLTAPPI